MIYFLSIVVIIIILIVTNVLIQPRSNNYNKNRYLDQKYLLNTINNIYNRKPLPSELLNICKVIQQYQKKYNQIPTDYDLKKIILKYKIK